MIVKADRKRIREIIECLDDRADEYLMMKRK